jgi:anion-transporting  ArsA/GET3 family ATPase
MTDLFKSNRLLICAGTGGVGKTTMSASLGMLAAQEGLKTLVLTIDPAHRLAQALGLEKGSVDEVSVPGVPNLWAAMIDPRREFDQFVLGAVDRGIAKGLFENRLYQQLVSNLNGSQEFTSLVKLVNVVSGGKYDLVILDTPPTQNAVDFLRAPEKIYALFQDSVMGWFSDPSANESWIKRTFHRTTKLVMTALESVTGSTFIAELKDFFSHISHLQKRIAAVSEQTSALMHDSKTGFVLVTGFDEAKLKETLEFQVDLDRENLSLRAVIVNRWFPEWTSGERLWPAEWDQDPDFQELKRYHQMFANYFSKRQEAYDKFAAQIGKLVPVVKLPDFKNTVEGLADLKTVAASLAEKWSERK